MPTLEQIKEQISKVDGASKLIRMPEIKELPKIFGEDEIVENLVRGFYINGKGLLIATNKRLIFIYKGIIYGIHVEDFPFDKISTIEYSTELLSGSITVVTFGNKTTITAVKKSKAREFSDFVRARITKPLIRSNQPDNVIDQLERLGSLKEKGLITEDEYNLQKQKLLQ